jgi:hypothetical protein
MAIYDYFLYETINVCMLLRRYHPRAANGREYWCPTQCAIDRIGQRGWFIGADEKLFAVRHADDDRAAPRYAVEPAARGDANAEAADWRGPGRDCAGDFAERYGFAGPTDQSEFSDELVAIDYAR